MKLLSFGRVKNGCWIGTLFSLLSVANLIQKVSAEQGQFVLGLIESDNTSYWVSRGYRTSIS